MTIGGVRTRLKDLEDATAMPLPDFLPLFERAEREKRTPENAGWLRLWSWGAGPPQGWNWLERWRKWRTRTLRGGFPAYPPCERKNSPVDPVEHALPGLSA